MIRVGRIDLLSSGAGSPQLQLRQLGLRGILAENTVTLDGDSSITLENASLYIDGSTGGHLNFRSGIIRVQNGTIQTLQGATLRVGRTGIGTLSVEGGLVDAGADLIVGGLAGSSGLLELKSGEVRIQNLLQIADDLGSEGEIVVQDGTVTALQTTSRIGDDGMGTLRIHGGVVRLADVSVGRDASGRGTLAMTGGRLEAEDLSLGRLGGAQGFATLLGGEVNLPNDSFYIGREGHGQVLVDGSTIHASNVVVSATSTSTGTIEIRSGKLRADRLLIGSHGAVVRFLGGLLETGHTEAGPQPFVVGDGQHLASFVLLGGDHHFPGGLVISSNATLTGVGSISGVVKVLPGGLNRVQNPGTALVAPRLGVAVRGGRLVISVPTEVGFVYRLEWRTGWDVPWVGVGRAEGTGVPWEFEPPNGSERLGIYRAIVD